MGGRMDVEAWRYRRRDGEGEQSVIGGTSMRDME